MKKQMKLVVAGASVLTLGMVGQAMAFHDGGVAKCESCHTMHNSLGGAKMTKTTSAREMLAPSCSRVQTRARPV